MIAVAARTQRAGMGQIWTASRMALPRRHLHAWGASSGHICGHISDRRPSAEGAVRGPRAGGPQRRNASVKTDTIDWTPMRSNRQINKSSQPKRGKSVVLTLLCLTPVVTLFLGVWQVQRLKWKNNLVAECEDRLTYKPLPLPKNIAPEDVANYEYRRVLLTGRFDYGHEMLVGPRLHDGERGYLLVVPFVRSSDGKKIIVDRGWIHENRVDPATRRLKHLSMPQGEVVIECLLRVAPKKGMFHIDHDVGTKVFRYVDLEVMARQNDALPIYATVVQDFNYHPERLVGAGQSAGQSAGHGSGNAEHHAAASKPPAWKFWRRGSTAAPADDFENPKLAKPFATSDEFDENQFVNAGVPLGKVAKVDYKNNHLQYVVTWWGLSFASAVLLFMVLRNRKIVNPMQEKLRHARRSM